jgi:hypothetical protein
MLRRKSLCCGSESRIYVYADPDRGVWWPRNCKILLLENQLIFFFLQKCSTFISGPPPKRWVQVPGDSSSYQKRTSCTSKHEFFTFSFLRVFFLTGSGSGFAFPMWIRIQPIKINADPDPQHWKKRWLKITRKKFTQVCLPMCPQQLRAMCVIPHSNPV